MPEKKNSERLPKLHNAMWPGLVGKGSPGAEPCIDLDTMLKLTRGAEVNGRRFDGVDLFLADPHISIDLNRDGANALAEKLLNLELPAGSVVAPVWGGTGGGSAMGGPSERKRFLQQVKKACRIASWLRELGARPTGVVRIDSATSVSEWAKDPVAGQKRIAATFKEACDIAEDFGERLAAEGEICWGGMHSWKHMKDLLERVGRPGRLGFQADMAHTMLYAMGHNAPEHALLRKDWDGSDPAQLDDALQRITTALRPWMIDFHVAQNDGTVHGSGTHDKTGHHCLPDDPAGKLDISRHAGYWLRDGSGKPTRAVEHICWDGCMFSNESMQRPETWNKILGTMLEVQQAHGWEDTKEKPQALRASQTKASRAASRGALRSRKRNTEQNKQKPNTMKKAKAAKKPAKKAPAKKGAKKK